MSGNLLGAPQVFDIGLQNSVKDVIWWQAVLVLLIRTELGRRSLLDGRPGNQFPLAVNPARQFVHHQFRYIGNDCKTSSHVSVKRTVSDRESRFITGAENQRTKLVGVRLLVVSTNA